MAFATAQPSSAVILGSGSTFVYDQGVLCYVRGYELRILRLRNQVDEEQVIDLRFVIDSEGFHPTSQSSMRVTLVNYSNNILSMICKTTGSSDILIALDVRPGPASRRRIRFRDYLVSSSRLFVRNNSTFFFYGTKSVHSSDGHRDWIVKGFNLHADSSLKKRESERCLQLEGFVGFDTGVSHCFGLHEGFFYAVSTQCSYGIEEVDWTSYYHCLRFPLDNPSPQAIERRRIWRRQHAEGPLNDSWTDLSLKADERTGELMIVESRREWKGGGSTSQRIFYTEPVKFRPKRTSLTEHSDLNSSESSTIKDDIDLDSDEEANHPLLPENDVLTKTLDANSRPSYSPPKYRRPSRVHPEPADAQTRNFILAHTKYRAYSSASFTFVDIVSDNTRRKPCLLLRIGSRRLASPLNSDGYIRCPQKDGITGKLLEGSEVEYADRPTVLWPPHDAPHELLDIVTPEHRADKLSASSDDRSLVYMIGPSDGCDKPIIFISFDQSIRFPGLPRLAPTRDETYRGAAGIDRDQYTVAHQTGKAHVSNCRYEPRTTVFNSIDDNMQMPEKANRCATQAGETSLQNDKDDHQDKRRKIEKWCRAEQAMWKSINKGFRLHYGLQVQPTEISKFTLKMSQR